MQVRVKACELLKEIITSPSQKCLDLKVLSDVIGILVDFLSENNSKIRERSEEALKMIFGQDKFEFNEVLISILSKGAKMNKAVTRYNH